MCYICEIFIYSEVKITGGTLQKLDRGGAWSFGKSLEGVLILSRL